MKNIFKLITLCVFLTAAITAFAAPNKKSDSLFMEGIRYHLTNQNEKAFEAYYLSSNINPQNFAVFYEIARLYLEQGRFSDALIYAERAFMLSDANKYIGDFLINLYENSYQFNKEAEVCLKLMEKYPDELDYAYRAADAYINTGNILKAIEVYDNLEKKFEVTDEWIREKVKLYMAMGDKKSREAAKNELEKAIKVFPQAVKYYEMLAQMAMESKNYKEAERNYKIIIEKDPSNALVHFSLADFYRKTGNQKESQKELIKGIENKNLDYNTKLEIISAYYGTGELDKKTDAKEILQNNEKIFEALIRAQPDRYEAYLWLYGNSFLLENCDKTLYAISNLERIGIADKQGVNVRTMRIIKAECLYKLKRMDEAFLLFDSLVREDPHDMTIKNNYAYFLAIENKDLNKAENLAKEVYEKMPNEISFIDTYAWILYLKGRYEEAKKLIERAIKMDGDKSVVIKEHYDKIMQAVKNPPVAKSDSGQASIAEPVPSDVIADTSFSANIKCVVSGLMDGDISLSGKIKVSTTQGGWISLSHGFVGEALRIRFYNDSIFIINRLENSCIVEGGVPVEILSKIFMADCSTKNFSFSISGFSLRVEDCGNSFMNVSASFGSSPIMLRMQYSGIEKNKLLDMPFRLPVDCK
ncbi:MAG: DUF4292 domain-containing protein [Bacteroidales bacterium]|jgi:tetratricopeptide (TPR) repeat protein|nr:DUF4292 domain-containing protein [Bacteroidales bacterium]